jgi:hypothetical protein
MPETCPECSALVTDIAVHQAWHYQVLTRDRIGPATETANVPGTTEVGPPIDTGA